MMLHRQWFHGQQSLQQKQVPHASGEVAEDQGSQCEDLWVMQVGALTEKITDGLSKESFTAKASGALL